MCASRLQQKKQAPGPPAVHQARCSVTRCLLGKNTEKKAGKGGHGFKSNALLLHSNTLDVTARVTQTQKGQTICLSHKMKKEGAKS